MKLIKAAAACALLCRCALAGCPLTEQEQNLADYIKVRRTRHSSGEIQKQIDAGTYTIESLSDDMYRWWVQLGLVDQGTAIENFVNLMQQAKQRADKTDFLQILLGWIGMIAGAVGEAGEMIAKAAEAMSQSLETWEAVAKGEGDSDFLEAAIKFRTQLPDSQTKQVRAVDDFINGMRNIPKKQSKQALLAAYDFVTNVIQSTPSYRKSFNQYYLKYLDSAGLGNSAFHYVFNAPYGNIQAVIWRPAPKGLDSCTVANFVYELNKGCISEQTPGFDKMDRAVEIMVNQGPAVGIRLDCSNLDPGAWTGCWLQGGYRGRGDASCYGVAQQTGGIYGFPPQAARDFCSRGLVDGDGYTACNYHTGFDGPASCQNGAGFFPPNCRRASTVSSNATQNSIIV